MATENKTTEQERQAVINMFVQMDQDTQHGLALAAEREAGKSPEPATKTPGEIVAKIRSTQAPEPPETRGK